MASREAILQVTYNQKIIRTMTFSVFLWEKVGKVHGYLVFKARRFRLAVFIDNMTLITHKTDYHRGNICSFNNINDLGWLLIGLERVTVVGRATSRHKKKERAILSKD